MLRPVDNPVLEGQSVGGDWLGWVMEATAVIEVDTPAGVLAAARAETAAAHRAEARKLELAVAWAAMHSTDSLDAAATLLTSYGDTGVPVAGAGAPLVAEFSIAEFAAAIGLPTEHGRTFLGEALELRYRLPRVWKRVTSGDLAAWRARHGNDPAGSLVLAGLDVVIDFAEGSGRQGDTADRHINI